MQNTWILVADRARARLFESGVAEAALAEIADFANPDARQPGKAFTRDRPPRTMESVGGTRHAIEPHTTPEDKVTQRFAHELEQALERGRVAHRYQRLILVAPKRFLGALDHALGEQVRSCLVAKVGKDLSALPAGEIHAHLAPYLDDPGAARH